MALRKSFVVTLALTSPGMLLASPAVTPASAASAIAKIDPQVAPSKSLLVEQVTFTGNQSFSSEVLQAQIADDLGKPMTLADLRSLADKVRQYYVNQGYKLARVVVPSQSFTEGKPVSLVVLEGWLDKIEVSGSERYAEQQVIDTLQSSGIQLGQAFTFDAVETGLTRLNRQSGIRVDSVLRPGAKQGATDLVVRVTELPRVQGSLEINNHGSKNTGETRIIPTVEWSNVTGRGDSLNFLGVQSLGGSGTFFARVGYNVPINVTGRRFSTYYSQGNITVGGALSPLNIRGDNRAFGLGILQERILARNKIDTFEAWLEAQDLNQQSLSTVIADDKVRKLRLGFTREHTDDEGRSLLALQVHQGLGSALGGMANNSPASSRAISGADGRFTKLTAEWTRLQRINQRLLLIPRLSAQFALDPLVVGEQITIGGFNSVTGHAPSFRSGDSGVVANLESRYAVLPDDDRFQFVARLDHGRIFVNDTFIGQRRSDDLSGMSLGFIVTPISRLFLRVDYAKPLGQRSDESQYIYLQARYTF